MAWTARSAATVRKNRHVPAAVLAIIGRKRLRELTAADVHAALASAAADRSTAAGRPGQAIRKARSG